MKSSLTLIGAIRITKCFRAPCILSSALFVQPAYSLPCRAFPIHARAMLVNNTISQEHGTWECLDQRTHIFEKKKGFQHKQKPQEKTGLIFQSQLGFMCLYVEYLCVVNSFPTGLGELCVWIGGSSLKQVDNPSCFNGMTR
jgi:hypothetical protein